MDRLDRMDAALGRFIIAWIRIVLLLVAITFNSAVQGFALTYFWTWYIVGPTGWDALSFSTAFGLCLMIRLLLVKRDSDSHADINVVSVTRKCFVYTVGSALILLLGYLGHLFLI